MKLSKEDKEFIEDFKADQQFYISREKFLNRNIPVKDYQIEDDGTWDQEKYLRELNLRINKQHANKIMSSF